MSTERLPGTKAIAQRIENAHTYFIGLCTDRGFTAAEGEKILEVYKRFRAIKLNSAQGRYDIKHGAFMDVDVMRRALAE